MNYKAYLKGEHWKHFRAFAVAFYGNKCMLCGKMGSVDLHHNNYDNLDKETLQDVIPLCRNCHGMFHDKLPQSESTLTAEIVEDNKEAEIVNPHIKFTAIFCYNKDLRSKLGDSYEILTEGFELDQLFLFSKHRENSSELRMDEQIMLQEMDLAHQLV